MEIVLFYLGLYVLYMLVTAPFRKRLSEYSALDWTAHFIKLMILITIVTLAINFVAVGLGVSTSAIVVIVIRSIIAFLCGWNMPMPSTKTGKIPPNWEEEN